MRIIHYLNFLCLIEYFGVVSAHNVLIMVVMGSHSSKYVFVPLANHLGQKGHKVTFVSTHDTNEEYNENVEEVLLRDYSNLQKQKMSQFNPFDDINKKDIWEAVKRIHNYIETGCRELWKDKLFLKFANDSKRHYDIVLVVGMFNECTFPLVHKLQAPYIFLFPSGLFGYLQWLQNVPVPYSYLPFSDKVLLPDMSFKDRLLNSLFQPAIILGQRLHFYLMDFVLKEVSPFETPSIDDMLKNISLVFSNEHVAMDYPKPNVPTIVHVGGIGTKRIKGTLPNDLKEFIEGSGEEGVILFSFGSVVKMNRMYMEIKTAFNNVFRKLKQRVIWKYETPEEFADVPDNVRLVKWVPQQEVLSHHKTRLFISHGGIASVTECISYGIPLIIIPFFGDQFANAAKGIYRGYALHLANDNLTETSISWAINEMLTNPMYKKNALNTSILLKDNLAPPLETAEYWINYVVRHKGAPHLKNEIAASLNWLQYFLIDVIAFIVLVLSFSLGLLLVIIKLFIRGFVCVKKKLNTKSAKTKDKKNR